MVLVGVSVSLLMCYSEHRLLVFSCSFAKSCPTPCNLTDCSAPGFPVLQPSSGVCRVGDPTISPSLVPFACCPRSFPASRSFPMTWLFTSGGQSIGASASVLQINIQRWFPLGLTGLIPFCPRGSQESFPAPQFENINSSVLSLLYSPTLIHICSWLLEKP